LSGFADPELPALAFYLALVMPAAHQTFINDMFLGPIQLYPDMS
jgi:hypothetical protein